VFSTIVATAPRHSFYSTHFQNRQRNYHLRWICKTIHSSIRHESHSLAFFHKRKPAWYPHIYLAISRTFYG
jgi:hypothetical protein